MHDIVHQLTIDASPETVFDAVATAPGLASWWGREVEGGSGEGGTVTVRTDRPDPDITLRIDTLEPPELAHLTCVEGPEEWPGTQIAFRLSEQDGATIVRFWHGGWEYEDGALPSCSFQWAMDLARLRQVCEAGASATAG